MAGIKYQCEFYSNNGSRYRMNLYHVDYSGTTIPFLAGPEGFQLTYEGETDSVYQTIKASSMQFDFVIQEAPTTSGDPTTGNIYDDLLSNNENKMFVIVQQYTGSVWRNFWAGDIIDDTVEIQDAPYPVQIRIKATDGIAKMKQKQYVPLSGGTNLTVLFYFQKAIEQTTYYSTLFPSTGGTSVVTIRNNPDRYHENMGSITDSAWQDAYNPMKLTMINEAAFIKKDGKYCTYYEILEQICTLWNCQFFLSSIWNEDLGCTWWLFSRYIMYFEDGTSILDTCRVFKNQAYDSGNTALNFAEYSVPDTSVNYTPTLTKTIGDADHPKFSGNKITYVAPLGRVKNVYNHDLFSRTWNTASSADNQYFNFNSVRISSTSGTQGFINTGTAVTNAILQSPIFPEGMPYNSDPEENDNNQGLFFNVTSGQDVIMVKGELTFNYMLVVDTTTAMGTLINNLSSVEGTPFTFDFKASIAVEFITSDKNAEDWANSQNDGSDLNDTEGQINLNGEFGGDTGNGMAKWENGSLIIHIKDCPITSATPITLTVPFSFISEPIPTSTGVTTINTLKRCQFTIQDFEDTYNLGSTMASLIGNGVNITNMNYQVNNFTISSLLDGSEMGDYFTTEVGLSTNGNSDASAEMVISPDLFIGDPPPYAVTNSGVSDVPTGSPAIYLGGLKIVAPAASNPTTTPPDQAQQNNRRWRTQQDGTFLPLNQILSREISKKRATPSYKYDISFENSDPTTTITFINTLKIDMKLNSGESADVQGFFPIGGTYTASTDSWKMTVEQFSSSTTTNITNDSYFNVNREMFLENANIIISPNF
tara:strand:- start:3054 stop:5507 length:2454 start_codon:yes stop_codon:yes gene_type:complete